MSRKSTKVDLSVNSTIITSEPAILHAIYINTTISAHTVEIKEGTIPGPLIPASAFAGNIYPFGDIEFLHGIVIDPDDSATGNITVVWEEWDPRIERDG